jgi:hypothetical protein
LIPGSGSVPRDVVLFGQGVQRLAPDKLLSNLPLERGTVG